MLYQRRGAFAESRRAFQRVLRLDNSLASAHNNLGNTLTLMGELDAAVASYRNAITCDPTLVAAHTNAAAGLYSLGRFDDALDHAKQAVEIDPDATPPRITLALITAAAHGTEAGLAEVDALLSYDPKNVEALAARAHLLLRLERFDAALAAAQRGLSLQPHYGLLLESLAGAQRGLGRTAEAIQTYEQAIELGHNKPGMLVLKASGQLEIGAFEEARLTLESSLALTPDNAAAWSTLSEIRPFPPGDPAIPFMEDQLARSPQLRGNDARTLMHFALGRAYHKSGDVPNAFRHFAAGNALKRARLTYDASADEKFTRDSVLTFTAAAIAMRHGRGDISRAPIFVIGMPRSGTTLIEQILASHPDVYGGGELTLFDQALAECGRDDVAKLGSRYLELVEEVAPGQKRVVDKLPSNFRHVALIHLALPNARIIHCTRDVLDTSFSCFSTNFTGRQDFSYDLTDIARYYRAYFALMQHWRAVLPPGIMLDARYEDVVAHLEASAKAILAFCRLPWNDAVLRYHETPRVIRTASYHQARRPIYASSVGSARPYRPYLQPLIDALSR